MSVGRSERTSLGRSYDLLVVTDTVLSLGDKNGPVTTVDELDARLSSIAAAVEEYRVKPVEVVLASGAEGPALFVSLGGPSSYAVYHSRHGNEFLSVGDGIDMNTDAVDVPPSAAIPNVLARDGMRQFMISGCRPEIIKWQQRKAVED